MTPSPPHMVFVLILLAIGLVLALACGCPEKHPVQFAPLPEGESILSIQQTSESPKAITELRLRSSSRLDWDLDLSRGESTMWSGEALYDLDDGRWIYCGYAFDPEMTAGCWVVDGTNATRISEPVFPSGEVDFVARTVRFSADGAWYATTKEGLEFSAGLDQPSQPVAMPLPGPFQRVDYSPKTERFAVLTEADDCCQIAVIDRATMHIVDALPMPDCHVNFRWSGDGSVLGIVQGNVVSLWTPGEELVALTERATGPDGRGERINLLAISPDGTRVLVRSSRHRKFAHNPFAGVSNVRWESFVIDIASKEWTRLPETGGVALWRRVL